MNERISYLEKQFRDAYMEYYYHLHRNPELSYQEKETHGYVTDILRTLPFSEVRTNVGGYGAVALLTGGRSGPVVAIRADMDALDIQETTGVSFASTKDGIMHACGHDAHTAILLGTAHVLCAMKDELAGSVKFIFQPAEEQTPRGGAQGMIEDGVLENPKVDAIIGLHVQSSFRVGEIGAQNGPVSASSDHIKIKITGSSAHASRPHEGTDAILVASAIVTALQSIISRNVDPRDTAVITIGVFHGGTRYNIIAPEVLLDGTVRTFNPEVTAKMPTLIKRVAENTAASFGAVAEVEYMKGYPSTINDPVVARTCRAAIVDVVGNDGLLPVKPVPAGGEDFSFFALEVPGAFAWLGCRAEDVAAGEATPHHNSNFLPDPKALNIGVRYLATATMKLLTEFRRA